MSKTKREMRPVEDRRRVCDRVNRSLDRLNITLPKLIQQIDREEVSVSELSPLLRGHARLSFVGLMALGLALTAPGWSHAFAQAPTPTTAGHIVGHATPGGPMAYQYDPDSDTVAFVKELVGAFHQHNYKLFGVLAVIALVFCLRKFIGPHVPWFATDQGGAALSILTGVAASLTAILVAGAPLSWTSILDGIWLGVTGGGGWAVGKKLLGPLLAKWFAAKPVIKPV